MVIRRQMPQQEVKSPLMVNTDQTVQKMTSEQYEE